MLSQIGTCGTLDMDVFTGMVALSESCAARDGGSHPYGPGETVFAASEPVDLAQTRLISCDAQPARSMHLPWPSLFAQSDGMCADWTREGLVSIDMETFAVIAVGDNLARRCCRC